MIAGQNKELGSFQQIDQVLSDQIRKHHTPSIQYVLFDKTRIIHQACAGFADIDNKVVANEHTTYNAYSVTKTFTAIAILQLDERGLLSIDQPVRTFLPELPYPPEITIRQVMAHTAGIPNPIPLRWIHLAEEHESFDADLYFKPVIKKNNKTKSKPNERFHYSNLGYVILGQVIENVSGLSYEDYILVNIIQRLNLEPNDLDFVVADFQRHAKGYHSRYGFSSFLLGFLVDKSKCMARPQGTWRAFKYNYVNGAAYGGLIGNPMSFVKYLQELLKPDCSLINEEYKRKMFTENRTNEGKPTGMCLSWFTGQLRGNTYFTHAGGGGGYYCELRIYRDLGIGSVMMMNRTGIKDERFLDKLDDYFIEEFVSSVSFVVKKTTP